jgi:hypothetical protein
MDYVIKNDKCMIDVLSAIPVNVITDLTGSEAWAAVFAKCRTGVNVYVLPECSDDYYPVEITEYDTDKAAIVTVTYYDSVDSNISAIAKIEFFYNGTMYTRQYINTGSAILTDWVSVDTSTLV